MALGVLDLFWTYPPGRTPEGALGLPWGLALEWHELGYGLRPALALAEDRKPRSKPRSVFTGTNSRKNPFCESSLGCQ
jgi:hypothetical protein